MSEEDSIFFFNYTVVIGTLAVLIIFFIVFARIFGDNQSAYMKTRAESTMENTSPVGKVNIAGQTSPPETTEQVAAVEPAGSTADAGGETIDKGKQVYSGLCFSCHSTGLPGIPQLGDTAAWADRISQGKALLYERAINGFTGSSGIMMPAKGGNPALTDDEVRAAVDYMIANSQ